MIKKISEKIKVNDQIIEAIPTRFKPNQYGFSKPVEWQDQTGQVYKINAPDFAKFKELPTTEEIIETHKKNAPKEDCDQCNKPATVFVPLCKDHYLNSKEDQTMLLESVASARVRIRIAQSLITSTKRSSETIELLQRALKGEYQQWDLYYSYKDELKGLTRDSLVDHFEEHADDEALHIDTIQRYLVSMNIQPTKQREEIPQIDVMNPEEIIKLQLKHEVEAIEIYQELLESIEEKDPLRIEIENILIKEEEHKQDLERYLNQKQGN